MESIQPVGIAVSVAITAALYASVGHGGASGYLAIMAILSFPPEAMKPGALLLNLIVAGIGTINYFKAGHLRVPLLWPFVLSSIPMSYVGARILVSPKIYGIALGATLIWAGIRLAVFTPKPAAAMEKRPLPSLTVTLVIGAALGFISGMVGVGGGIFLSPIFILMRWADPKETGAVSAAFIWLNSAAGLWGHAHTGITWPADLPLWIAAAVLGGALGSYFGARKLSVLTLRRILAMVLLVAAAKSFLTALK